MDDDEFEDDLNKLLTELSQNTDIVEVKEKIREMENINPENVNEKIYEKIAILSDMATKVAEVMQEKIETGSPFEADVQAFIGAVNAMAKSIDIMNSKVEPEKKLLLTHELQKEREEIKHKNALELQALRNEAKSIGNNNNITQNNYLTVGDREEVIKALNENRKSIVDV